MGVSVSVCVNVDAVGADVGAVSVRKDTVSSVALSGGEECTRGTASERDQQHAAVRAQRSFDSQTMPVSDE